MTGTLLICLLALILPLSAWALQPQGGDEGVSGESVHVVAAGETLWAISARYAVASEAIVAANQLVDPDRLSIGQVLRIPGQARGAVSDERPLFEAPRRSSPPLPSTDETADESRPPAAASSARLNDLVHHYVDMARTNVRTVDGRRAIVPSPIYANGIYARDAFYAAFGVEDVALSEESFRWFERAQNAESGQITTAVPFDPADGSLQPQDDETTLLFLIWAGMLHRQGVAVDSAVVAGAWRFIQSHVDDGQYVSPAGPFRYWADCWASDAPDVISYNQGFYALAARFALEMQVNGVTQPIVADAVDGYRRLFRPDLGFLPLSGRGSGNDMQDVSALLPELLHRYLFDRGMLDDGQVKFSVDRQLATSAVYAEDGTLVGIKNIAMANGAFADPANFSCTSMRRPGDYHNGGYWPMYTLAQLALAYQINPQTKERTAIEQLVEIELADGSPKEYWELSPGREGLLQPGRDEYSWNALLVPIFRWAGLVE